MKFSIPKRRGLLDFHRPLHGTDADSTHPLVNLKPESRQCLKNLANYTPPKNHLRYPKSRSAAVLVALFVGRMGDLYILLSRRASTLRSFPGDTSLPGGKWERGDRSLEYTARREAFEEIGLPMDRRIVPLLCTLEPFLAGNHLIVTPVVVLVLDKTIRPILNSVEVHSLFSHPLISLLRSESPYPSEPDTLELKYHTSVDINWQGHANKVRMHRFLTGREAGGTKPIFGFTAAILIRVAMIGYRLAPDYELDAPGQPSHTERIAYALKHHPVFREAMVKEGLIKPEKLHSDHMGKLENHGSAVAPASPSASPAPPRRRLPSSEAGRGQDPHWSQEDQSATRTAQQQPLPPHGRRPREQAHDQEAKPEPRNLTPPAEKSCDVEDKRVPRGKVRSRL